MVQHDLDQDGKPAKSEVWEWIKALLIAAVLVTVIRLFVFSPFIVSGPSMQPNFWDGERMIVNKFIYYFSKPKYGDVIVFHATEEKDYIKRVIGLPGDMVKVIGDDVYVNGNRIDEPYIQQEKDRAASAGTTYNRTDYKITAAGVEEVAIPAGNVFVMGDNRPVSQDSREIGFIPTKKIIGRTDLVFWPLNKLHLIKHG